MNEKAKPATGRARSKPAPPPDPDRLIRQSAGVYRSEDERFEVSQSDANWYLVDLERTNDFGQELIHGPFGTLKEVRESIPGARKVTPLSRPKISAAAKRAAEAKQPPAPPKSWIDRLPDEEASAVRRLIRAVEREGLADAESMVKATRGQGADELAERLLERRLQALIEESEGDDRRRARELVRRVLAILTEAGTATPEPLPRWALVMLESGADEPGRLRPKV